LETLRLKASESSIDALCFAQGDTTLMTGHGDGSIRVWYLHEWAKIKLER
jgi:hypothetical protein